MPKLIIITFFVLYTFETSAAINTFQSVPIHFISSDFEKKHPKYFEIIRKKIETFSQLSTDEEIVKSVKNQNAEQISKDLIIKRDQEWRATLKETKMKRELKVKKASRYLKYLTTNKYKEILSEAILIDRQGANVAAFPLTTDYFQGDEDKWQKSMNGGKCRIVISDLAYDESADSKIVQVSLPIYDGKFGSDNCIGVLILGIKDLYIRKNI